MPAAPLLERYGVPVPLWGATPARRALASAPSVDRAPALHAPHVLLLAGVAPAQRARAASPPAPSGALLPQVLDVPPWSPPEAADVPLLQTPEAQPRPVPVAPLLERYGLPARWQGPHRRGVRRWLPRRCVAHRRRVRLRYSCRWRLYRRNVRVLHPRWHSLGRWCYRRLRYPIGTTGGAGAARAGGIPACTARGRNPHTYYGHHHLILLTIYCRYLACVCSALSCLDCTRSLVPFDVPLYCLLPHVQLGLALPSGVSTSTRPLCNIARTRNPKITPCLHGPESLKALRLVEETLLCPYEES